MKRYKLLKDTVNCKAGTIFESKSEGLYGNNGYGEISFAHGTINNFDEWFLEIKETGWKPKMHQEYWLITDGGVLSKTVWLDGILDNVRYTNGNCYRTKEDCEQAERVQIARTTIKRSSDFVPDWSDANQEKWYVAYDHSEKCLCAERCFVLNNGAIVYYKTIEGTEQVMEDLEPDYLLHFGVEE